MDDDFHQLINLSIKELDEPSTSWVVRQIRAEGQEMIVRNEILREQQRGRLQQRRLLEEAATGEAATEEADDAEDGGNETPFESGTKRGRGRPPKARGKGRLP